ncbi:beta-hydroxyacyl-ACP dehydratase [Parabacteroides distasonis]|uniref:beta-hydroxyacyl-ACP dehydratase n=1 Tax=Parabacteroides distasonis TaxID=823 RepID=UPI00232FA07E|nr:beta-hydroxyacyl-ACP dehydratase [Parabacteroides distasonis]MDB9029200.1 beta-hydroxyacyl-ACP dehydratase [Parabacteroides distasonis]MDB9075001.1 beta-hydroxyacyl-ACP dehydratase [Parabacteroides distasonis]
MKCEDIKKLLPQRAPILMVDELLDVNCEEAQASFTVRSDNFFLDREGRLEASGLIEHIAQSASAFAGYMALLAGATEPPMGYIGEVKNFSCCRRPRTGDELRTTIRLGPEAGGVMLLSGETRVGEKIVADTQMKIFLQ